VKREGKDERKHEHWLIKEEARKKEGGSKHKGPTKKGRTAWAVKRAIWGEKGEDLENEKKRTDQTCENRRGEGQKKEKRERKIRPVRTACNLVWQKKRGGKGERKGRGPAVERQTRELLKRRGQGPEGGRKWVRLRTGRGGEEQRKEIKKVENVARKR